MNYKKIFFPIGGGDELEERLYAALLIAKKFDTQLEVLKCGLKSNINIHKTLSIPRDILSKIDEVIDNKYEDENNEIKAIFEKAALEVGIKISEETSNEKSFAHLKIREGIRSTLI